MSWPQVELDPVARLRAISAALPHVSLEERVIEAPFERVWPFIEDMEHGVPQFLHARAQRILAPVELVIAQPADSRAATSGS